MANFMRSTLLFLLTFGSFSALADWNNQSHVAIGVDLSDNREGDTPIGVFDARFWATEQIFLEGYATSQENHQWAIGGDLVSFTNVDLVGKIGQVDGHAHGRVYFGVDLGPNDLPWVNLAIGAECLERSVAVYEVEDDSDSNREEEELKEYKCTSSGDEAYYAGQVNLYAHVYETPVHVYGRAHRGLFERGYSAGFQVQLTDRWGFWVSYLKAIPREDRLTARLKGDAEDAPLTNVNTFEDMVGEERAGFGLEYVF